MKLNVFLLLCQRHFVSETRRTIVIFDDLRFVLVSETVFLTVVHFGEHIFTGITLVRGYNVRGTKMRLERVLGGEDFTATPSRTL